MLSFIKKLLKKDKIDDTWVKKSEQDTFFFKEECEQEARLLLTVNKLIDGYLEIDNEKDAADTANNWIDSEAVHIRENNDFDCTIDYFMPAQPEKQMEELTEQDPAFEKSQKYIAAMVPSNEQMGVKLKALKDKVREEIEKLMSTCSNQKGGLSFSLDVLGALNDQNQAFLLEMRDELKIKQTVNKPKEDDDLHKRCAQLADGGNIFNSKSSLLKKICKEAEDIVVCKREIMRRQYAIRFFSWLQIALQENVYIIRKTGSLLDYIRQTNNQKLAKMISNNTEGITIGAKDIKRDDFSKILPKNNILSLDDLEVKDVVDLITKFAEEKIKETQL